MGINKNTIMQNPSIINLPSTNYNDRYGKEIIQKSLNHPRNLRKRELYWMIHEQTEWSIYTITVTFVGLKPVIASYGMKGAAMHEFDHHVLPKIRRRLCRSKKHWEKVLPTPEFVVYEYQQGSFFKPVPKSNSPHHVHGLLAVKKRVEAKIFDKEASALDERLQKDLASVRTVGSFLIEPLRVDEAENWYHYMIKDKTAADLEWH